MIATALAVSIDYSLFLLSRFQKEVQGGRGVIEAVTIMVGTSGKIVGVSGFTLFLCFFMMQYLPVNLIASMGICAAITVLMSLGTALTLTPVMLLSYPTFFMSFKKGGMSCEECGCCEVPDNLFPTGGYDNMAEGRTSQGGGAIIIMSEAAKQAEEDNFFAKSYWRRFGEVVTGQAKYPILAVLVAVAIPFGLLSLPHFAHSAGLVPLMPRKGNAFDTVMELQNLFGVGALFPTTFLLVPPTRFNPVTDAANLTAWRQKTCKALDAIAKQVEDTNTDSNVAIFTKGAFIGDMTMFGKCLPTGNPIGGANYWNNQSGFYTATKIMIEYPIDPFSSVGQHWINRLRDATSDHPEVGTWYITGEGPNQMDVANKTFAALPGMIALMMAVVLLLIGLAFRSFVAPIRAVFTLLWMLVMTFGLAVFAFQDGCFDWLSWPQMGTRPTGAMYWMSPCIAFSVLVGLGLDYDIFYTERVVEEREKGWGDREAAVRALAFTSNTISAAGVIMVVAFLALMVSSTPVLNEIAFLLIVGILIDCFLSTKIIIPAGIAVLDGIHFWPASFEEGVGGALDLSHGRPSHMGEGMRQSDWGGPAGGSIPEDHAYTGFQPEDDNLVPPTPPRPPGNRPAMRNTGSIHGV